MFVKQFAAKGGASVIGKALPFGIGAAIGGAGNNILGRRVLTTSHKAFGSAPIDLPLELEPVPGAEKLDDALEWAVERAEANDDLSGAVLVTGSITLVAEARILLGKTEA